MSKVGSLRTEARGGFGGVLGLLMPLPLCSFPPLDIGQDIPDSQGYPDTGLRMRKRLYCSFCGKSDKEVAKLVAGPGGLHICNACVAICQVIMAGEQPGPCRDFDPKTWPTDRLLALLSPVNATVESHRQHLQGVVDTLRSRDISWAKIAEPLGISRQSAWERFG